MKPNYTHTNPDGSTVQIYKHPTASIGERASIGEWASIASEAVILIGESLHGKSAKYYWDLYKLKNEYQFRFGCETHPLKFWTLANIKKLCQKHNDLEQEKVIRKLIRVAKEFIKE